MTARHHLIARLAQVRLERRGRGDCEEVWKGGRAAAPGGRPPPPHRPPCTGTPSVRGGGRGGNVEGSYTP